MLKTVSASVLTLVIALVPAAPRETVDNEMNARIRKEGKGRDAAAVQQGRDAASACGPGGGPVDHVCSGSGIDWRPSIGICAALAAPRGSQTVKCVPSSAVDCTEIVPPCAAIIWREM